MPKKTKTVSLKKLKKDKRLGRFLPLLTLVTGIMAGLVLAWLQPPNLHPKNLVWAADSTVEVPGDLAEFLRLQDDCQAYRGSGSPKGVGLWGVYQVSQDKFAKVSYGCGHGLSRYIMAVKDGGKWQLLQPTQYFAPAPNNFLPNCSFIDQYKIDKSIEPFCIEANGTPRENSNS